MQTIKKKKKVAKPKQSSVFMSYKAKDAVKIISILKQTEFT